MKRRKKKDSSFLSSPGAKSLMSMGGAIAYGMAREKISDFIANSKIGQMLPVTQFTDEAVMLGVNYLARKLIGNKNIPIVSGALRAQKYVELARIGQTVMDVGIGNIFSTSGITSGSSEYQL